MEQVVLILVTFMNNLKHVFPCYFELVMVLVITLSGLEIWTFNENFEYYDIALP